MSVDLYCDVVPLSSSGSQSVSPIPVRFGNMNSIHTRCFDVGIFPLLEIRSIKCTAEKKVELRFELMHR